MKAILRGSSAQPVVDRVYLAPTRQWKKKPLSKETLAGIASLREQLRKDRFDLCVDMQGSIRSALIGWMSSSGELAGPSDPREAPARWFYGSPIRTSAVHVIEQGCEVLSGATGLPLRPERIDFPVDKGAEAVCERILQELVPRGERFALIAPTAGWGAKQWPAERFGAVAAALAQMGIRTLVNAPSEEDRTARAVIAASHGSAALAAGGISLLIELLRRASVVIAGDTGPLHLAAALERPVVALFGPTDPARNGPYGTQAKVLRHGRERRDHRRRSEPEAGLMEITVEEVVAAARELLQD